VRPDPELAGLGLARDRHRRVPVDVHRVRGVAGVPGEEITLEAERRRAQHEQLVRELAHAGQVSHDRRLQVRHFLRVDIGLEPVPVDVGVSGWLIGPDREGFLQVRRGLGALGVGVRLDAWRQPAPARHGHRVSLLDLARQREERSGLCAHPCPHIVRDAMPGDQEEADAPQGAVHLGGDGSTGLRVAAEPRRQVNHRD